MRFLPVLAGTLLLAISANATVLQEPVVLNQRPRGEHTAWEYVLDTQERFWLAYYSADNNLYVRRPDGSEVALGAEDRQRAISGLAIGAGQDSLSVLWRDKLPQKSLYYLPNLKASGALPKPLLVGGDEQPLTRLKMAKQDGFTYLLWYGEKGDPETRRKYHLYFRSVENDGQTLSEIQRVLPGYYPTWIVDGGDQIPIFTWTELNNRRVMAMRSFDRQKKTFGPVVEMTEAPDISPVFHAFSSAGRWFLMWLGHYGDGSELLLEGVYSDDKGQTWKRFTFESLRGLDLSKLDTAVDGQGRILLAISGSWRSREPGAKNDIHLIRSLDNGTTWQEPQRIRPAAIRQTEARFPTVAFGPETGSVLVVWEDWRGIRPNVYAAYSTDYGATWQEEAPIGPLSRTNLGLDFRVKPLTVQNGRYYLVAKRYQNDALRENQDLVLYTFTPDELKQRAAEAVQERARTQPTEARLRERVAAYWQALEQEDYKTVYALSDPFFQAKRPINEYLSRMGGIKYHTHEAGAIDLKGHIAKVKMKIEASVPGIPWREQKITRPKQPYDLTDTWLFVDGDWYREFYEESTETRYTRY